MEHDNRENALCANMLEALRIAREKHPVFARGELKALNAIWDEYCELYRATQNESPERQKAEAMDLAVCALRFYLGEHLDK